MENAYECGKILRSRMKNCIAGIISITYLKQPGNKNQHINFFWIAGL